MTTGSTIRIRPDDKQTLRELAEQMNLSMVDVLSDAITLLRRQVVLDSTVQAYRQLHQSDAGAQEEQAEVDLWDTATLADADMEDRS